MKLKQDESSERETDSKNTMPAHIGSFILRNTKRLMKIFISEIDGFKTINVYYSDTDSLYIEKKPWDIIEKAELVGESLRPGKKDEKWWFFRWIAPGS